MKSLKAAFLLVALTSVLFSCSEASDGERNTGILADEWAVSSIKQEIADKENSLLAAEGDVFWTESGTSWHESYSCSYLSNSKTVYHGTLEEAKLEGKSKPCSRCSGEN